MATLQQKHRSVLVQVALGLTVRRVELAAACWRETAGTHYRRWGGGLGWIGV